MPPVSLYPNMFADLQAASGYLSVDQSNKIVVLMDQDPAIYQRSLVGIWVTGVGKDWELESRKHPWVWANLMRYFNR